MDNCNWFENWFDTNYYHLLYKHRDNEEAQKFIRKLIDHIKPVHNEKVLDLACGRGRHSFFLNEHALNVTGVDLSEKNIRYAKQFENENLRFEIKDMRDDLGTNEFNIIFNLFTSFGYFDDEKDDLKVLSNISNALVSNGIFVFDFLNADKVKHMAPRNEHVSEEGVNFDSHKEVLGNFIIKNIEVKDKENCQRFSEKVKLIPKSWFEKSFDTVGLKIQNVFGDYELGPYLPDSERLIIIAKKHM